MCTNALSLLLFTYCCFVPDVIATTSSPIITTKSGKIRGLLVQTPTNKSVAVYQFTSIPYAQPPIGTLRFKKTEHVVPRNTTEVFDATKLPTPCTQHSTDFDGTIEYGGEDCLVLNIWVPQEVVDSLVDLNGTTGNHSALLSVFVFMHGGGFSEGYTRDAAYNGTVLAGVNNIIVVTIQYRLGSLGFGYLGNEDVPGNMGLWDQLEALKWIKENIEAFGGNNSEVTIAGEDAGAASVTSHIVSPHSRNYFQRAIVQSGSSIAPWGCRHSYDARKITNSVFDAVCGGKTNMTTMECLRSTDATRFPVLDNQSFSEVYHYNFVPVIDGDFIPEHPQILIMSGNYNKVPLLIGANKDEGSMFVMMSQAASDILPTFTSPDRSLDGLTYANFKTLLSDRFKLLGSANSHSTLLQAVELQYWPRSNDGNPHGSEIFQMVTNADGDYGMLCPTFAWASVTSSSSKGAGAKTFAYFFTQRRSDHWAPDYMGVLHGDELGFVFGGPFFPPTSESLTYTKNERDLSKVMMTYWTNFVKYGDPNNGNTSDLREWPAYVGNSCHEQYFNINIATQVTNRTNSESVICGLKKRQCLFWQDYIPKLANIIPAPASASSPSTVKPVSCPTTLVSQPISAKNRADFVSAHLLLFFFILFFSLTFS